MKKRKIKGRYLTPLIITIFILLTGVLIGLKINESRVSRIEDLRGDIEISLKENEILEHLFKENPCNVELENIYPRLNKIQNEIIILEEQLGKTHQIVIETKKPYILLLLKQYLLYNEKKSRCKTEEKIVLFFYSNKKENLRESENQGFLLDYFKTKHSEEKIMIFAIDGNLDLGSIGVMKKKYNVTVFPSLVINEITYSGFQNKESLLDIFNITE